MNKYQEALDWLMGCDDSCGTERDLLQELVDRATPIKHIVEHCPICDESVRLLVTELDKANQTSFYEVNHCCNCGQAIDWSEND